jgi:hypothetical protein
VFCRIAHFLLSLLSSEIGDLSEWVSTSGTKKSPQGQNLESRALGEDSHLVFRQKFMDEERRVSRCVVVDEHPGLVSPSLRPLPLPRLPVKLSIDCLTTWNKLMMKDALHIIINVKKKKNDQQYLYI